MFNTITVAVLAVIGSVIGFLYYEYSTSKLVIEQLNTQISALSLTTKAMVKSAEANNSMINELNEIINNLRDDNTQFQNELAVVAAEANNGSKDKDYLSCVIPDTTSKLLKLKPKVKSK